MSTNEGSSIRSSAWRLAKALVTSPSKAADRLQLDADAVPSALVIYLVYLFVSVAYYSWKPADFPAIPDTPLAHSPVSQSPVFWAKVQAWNPVLTGIWLVFLAWFAAQLKTGRLALRIFLTALVWVVPSVVIVLWAGGQVPKVALLFAWLAVLGPMVPALRARPPEAWRPLAGLTLSVVIVNLALCPFFVAAVAMRSQFGYQALEIAMLLWTLGLAAKLLAKIEGMPTPRAFAAIFFSMVAQMAAVFSLHIGGLVSKDILKALMSV